MSVALQVPPDVDSLLVEDKPGWNVAAPAGGRPRRGRALVRKPDPARPVRHLPVHRAQPGRGGELEWKVIQQLHGRDRPLDRPARQRAAGPAHRHHRVGQPAGRDQHRVGHRRDRSTGGAATPRPRTAAEATGTATRCPIVLGRGRAGGGAGGARHRAGRAQTLAGPDLTGGSSCALPRGRPGGAHARPRARAHGGNPNFRSEFESIQPAVPGMQVEVLNYDDRLLLINRTGKTVRDRAATSASRMRGCARTARWRSTAAPPPTT